MDETEMDYNKRLIVKANQYYREHMKVLVSNHANCKIYNINVLILTNNKVLEKSYKDNEGVDVVTVGNVSSECCLDE